MIKGLEPFDEELRSSILKMLADSWDLSEDIEITRIKDNIIDINGSKFYVINDIEANSKLQDYNDNEFENYFYDLTPSQKDYIDVDLWIEENGYKSFKDFLIEVEHLQVMTQEYYGSYNFYALR